MTPMDLRNWRYVNGRLTQAALAKHLNIHRNTIANYEAGRTPIPVDFEARLPLKVESGRAVHRYVGPPMAHLRPDLKLFYKERLSNGTHYIADKEHPRSLLREQFGSGLIPIEVLESPEYLEALARHRSGGK